MSVVNAANSEGTTQNKVQDTTISKYTEQNETVGRIITTGQ